MNRAYRFLLAGLLLALSISFAGLGWAQSPPTTGTPPFGSFGGGPEVINLANLNVHWDVPVLAKPGRGGFNFTYDLSYDSSVWAGGVSSGSSLWYPVGNWGWRGVTEASMGYLRYTSSFHFACQIWNPDDRRYDKYYYYLYNFYAYGDPWGIPHPLNVGTLEYDLTNGNCSNDPNLPSYATGTISDGSGYFYSLQVPPSQGLEGISPPSGGAIHPPLGSGAGAANGTDRNGNQITVNSSGQFFDTLSSTTPVLTVTGSSPMTFTYTAPSGANASYTMKYTAYTVKSNFGCPNISEYGPTSNNLVSEIDLPDWNANTNPNSRYTFTYESYVQNSTTYYTGRLASVTLPTGGTISYTYSGGNNGINCSDGSTATLTRTTPDGTWIYAHSESGTAWTTLVTDPQNNQTNMNFQGIYETQRQVYSGLQSGGNLLRQWTTCYNGNTSSCNTTAVTPPITQRNVTDQYSSSGLQCQHNYWYNSVGGLSEQDDYDYGSGAHGALLRKTLITYAPLGNNITAFRQMVTVCNGSGSSSGCAGPSGGNTGTVVAQTNYNYDETTPTTTSGITQHTSVSGSRGNLTSINYPVSGVTSHSTYYDTGVLNTSQDVNGATTTYNYGTDATKNCQMAFPTSISEPLSMSRSFAWNCIGAVMTSITDENGNPTSTTYSDTAFWRPASVSFPDGGQTSWSYNSTSVTTTTKMNSSQNIVSTTLLDGLGRTSQTQLNDPEGPSTDYSVLTYDAVGRPYKAYNPTRCSPPTTNCGEATWGYTTTAYDALSRPTSVTLQDGSVASASYPNNTVTITDPAGNVRQSTFDGLGRLTQVLEDPGTSPHWNYETDYAYDALGNLLCVGQKGTNSGTWSGCGSIPSGWRGRTYGYDAMSRLTSEANPETGTITYKYDSDSNCASPNSSSGDLISRTDARSIRTCFQYDTLHRLTQKNYSDSTPTAFYSWDGSGRWGVTQTNTTGRLGEEWTGTSCCATGGAAIFGYDSMGRIVMNEQYTATIGYRPMNYTYDLAGNMLTYTDGVGETYTQSFDTAGRVTQLNSSWVDSQHPATLATVDSSLGYLAPGALRKMTLGNNLTQTAAFNNNLQTCRVNLNSSGTALGTCADSIPSATVQDFSYSFNAGSTDNGNVASWTASGQQAFTRSFSYDSLNRLSAMQETSGTAESCKPPSSTSNPYNLSWTYDAWGNRNAQTPNSGTCSFSQSANSSNQLGSPYQYDAAGNMINDGNHTYFYDAEERLIQVDGSSGYCSSGTGTAATACYLYDALSHRTTKSVGAAQTNYIYGLDGNVISEVDQNNVWMNAYPRLGGQLVAQYLIGSPRTQFILSDHLGSARVLTKYDGTFVDSLDFLPFGEQIAGGSITTHKFTGDERDSETNLDHTQFRQYSSQLGRWMHPDPAGLAAVDITNPQSWNRYGYVTNRPTYAVDPSGLCDVIVGGFTQTPGTAATDTQQFLAGKIGADQAYPYSGLNGVQSFGAAYGPEATEVASAAILNAADQSGGQPFTIYAFSGGAQAVANAWPSLPQSVQKQATVFYVSPGHVPFGKSLPPGIVYQGQGPLDSFVTALSPNGSLTECGHDANCEFGALSDLILNGNPYGGRFPLACKVPTVFLGSGGGRGGGGRGDSGGGGDNGPFGAGPGGGGAFGGVDQGGPIFVESCVFVGSSIHCEIHRLQ